MIGATTQIMIDLADPALRNDEKSQSNYRPKTMGMSVLVFALGCGTVALMFMQFGAWCFTIPPILGLSLIARVAAPAEQ